jgi:hypothetical protein
MACPNGCRKGEIAGRTCHRCKGRGVVVRYDHEVNPAFIGSTYVEPSDPVCERLDRLVCEIRQRDELLGYWFVIHAEFIDQRTGDQAMRAQRMGIIYGTYKSRLSRALEWLGLALQDRREAKMIPFPYKRADEDSQNLLTSCNEIVQFSPD